MAITTISARTGTRTALHVSSGLDVADIRPLLGHARLDTTQRYVLVRSAKARAAVETAAARLGSPRRDQRREIS